MSEPSKKCPKCRRPDSDQYCSCEYYEKQTDMAIDDAFSREERFVIEHLLARIRELEKRVADLEE